MKPEHKLEMQANKILGEFIGTLEGICLWEIPGELRALIKIKIDKLRETEIISVINKL